MARNYAVFIVLMSVLFSCRKERSFETNTGVPIVNQQWEFKEAGSSFNGPMDSASILTIGVANSLSLSGPSADGKGEIALQILSTGAIVKGDYKNPQILFQYIQNGSTIFQNSSADDFTITIAAIDSFSVTGTFSGVATDSVGNKQTISNGKFTAALTGAIPPVGRGTLTVWSKLLCDGSGSIYIKVGDSISAITQASATEPSCGAPGTASFSLPAGAYTVIAACGTDTITLDAAVLPDVCATLEVDFSQLANQDYFPLQSRWTYGNSDDYENDTLAIESSGDVTFGIDVFKKFHNDKTLETKYYRKDGNVYYQYIDSAFGFPLLSPFQIIILQDNVSAGTFWDSDPPYNVPSLGTFKIRSTVTQKDYIETINGQTYEHCIEVTSELYRLDGVKWNDADTGYRTVFAKGIGIIFYQDLNTTTDWEIRNYSVSF